MKTVHLIHFYYLYFYANYVFYLCNYLLVNC